MNIKGLVTYLLTVLYGISYGIQSVETMGFALWRMNCLNVLPKRHNDCLSLSDNLAMF